MKQIPLSRGMFALVDDEDFVELAQYRWFAMRGKHTFYAVRNQRVAPNDWTSVLMHRQVMSDASIVDHIDGNGLNNQRSNLRSATQTQNSANQRKTRGTSKFKGVYWDKLRNKWQAEVRCNGTRVRLGRFASEAEAAAAYDKKALELFGSFAKTNTHGVQ